MNYMSELNDIDNLVLLIINNEFDKIENSNRLYEKFTKNMNTHVDKNIELKNELTSFVCKNFFKQKSSFTNFLNLINELFNKAICKYILLQKLNTNDIIFIYKGGNLFNLYFRKLILQLPNNSNKIFINKYNYFFDKSDCDFSIIINPSLSIEVFNKIHNDMTKLSYLILNRIRNIFLLDKKKYFDIFKFNDEYLNDIFTNLINVLNKITHDENYNNNLAKRKINYLCFSNKVFSSNNNCLPNCFLFKNNSYKNDLIILNMNNDKVSNIQNVGLYPIIRTHNLFSKYYNNINLFLDNHIQKNIIHDDICDFYISFNDDIKYIANQKLFDFSLIRMKYNFLLYYNDHDCLENLNLGGELIDISIPKINSSEHVDFYKNLNNNIIEIKYLNSLFKIYSIDYFIHDMYNLIMEKSYLPWMNLKYVKRLKRIMFLYFYKTIVSFSYNEALEIIMNLIADLEKCLITNDIKNNVHIIHNDTLLNVYDLILFTQNKMNCILDDIDYKYYDIKFFIEFIYNIIDNLNNFKYILENVIDFKNSMNLMIDEYDNFNFLLSFNDDN